MLVLLLACSSASPLVGETLTDDGTWRLALESTSYDQGAADLELAATDADGEAPATGLGIVARPGMDEMDHTMALADFEDLGDGSYSAVVTFDMPGIWTLTGYAGDEASTEGFTFVVEVRP